MADKRIERLLKTLKLQSKPGVLTASLFMLGALEAVVLLLWPGVAGFIGSQLALLLIVVLAVAIVDAGRVWDNRLFDDLYCPPGDNGLPPEGGKFLEDERPWSGLLPSGPALTQRRKGASDALDHPTSGLYGASRDHLSSSPEGLSALAEADEPLELSKGVRALLAPLLGLLAASGLVAIGTAVAGGDNLITWAAVAGAALLLWPVFAYVFVHRRYEHMIRLYRAVAHSVGPTG